MRMPGSGWASPNSTRPSVGWAVARSLASQTQPAICTEELVLLCEEMGIDTGVDLDAVIEVGRMAEEIVGHQLPSELIHAGSLDAFRRRPAP